MVQRLSGRITKAFPIARKEEYKVYPKLNVYNVFNIDQTNMQEVRPDMYEKYIADMKSEKPHTSEKSFRFEPMDK